MISWIQKYFQRHFRTVFAVLLVATVISLIFAFNASGGFGRATVERPRASRPYFGLDLALVEDQQQLLGDANVSYTLQNGSPPGELLQGFALRRHAELWLADQYHLPAPSPDELKAHIHTLHAFFDPKTLQFDAASYANFRDSLKTNPQLTEADVGRILSDDVRAHQIEILLAGPGYVLPGDVRSELELAESTWTVALASVDYASFAPALDPAPAELEKFFKDNSARYQISPQVRVDAISFPAEAHLAKVTVTDAEVRAYYESNKFRFKKPAPPALLTPTTPAPDNPEADFAAARPAVEAELRLERARRLATTAAADFAVQLFEQKTTPATLDALLAARSLARKPLAPFAADTVPAELTASDPRSGANAAAAAFKLEAAHPFSEEIPTSLGAAILIWQESIPARQPLFADVKDRVATDWRAAEKERLFTELGKTLRTRLEASLKSGTPLEQAVTDAASSTSSAKLEVKTYPGFTLTEKIAQQRALAQQRPPGSPDDLAPVLRQLFALQKGQLAEMVVVPGKTDDTPEKGLILYAADKKAPDLSPTGAAFTATRQRLSAQLADYNSNTAMAELIQHELAKSAPVPAADQP